MYGYYWEQFSYWASQGWTTEDSFSAEAARDEEARSEERSEQLDAMELEKERHESSAGCDQVSGEPDENPADITELVRSLNLEAECGDVKKSLHCSYANEPHDGGDQKRPASSGSTVTGSKFHILKV